MKRNRLWLVGLMLLTALMLIFWGQLPQRSSQQTRKPILALPAQAQSPTPQASPSPLPPPPTPTAPATIPIETLSVPPLPLGGNYVDPQGRFQVGILEGYNVSSVGNSPLFESSDGNLAYTVVVQERVTNQRLTEATLTQIAIETFQRGEGFQAGDFIPLFWGGVRVPWTGSLTMGRNTQPVSGVILSSQPKNDVLMLLIAATEMGRDRIPAAVSALADSLKPVNNTINN